MSLLSRLAVQAARAYGILSSNPNNVSADYLVVAGGGGGGQGGGGAGGFRTSAGTSGGGASAENSITLSTLNTYSITVGAGGGSATNGSNSSLSGTGLTTITSTGGGTGGIFSGSVNGSTGGSGGGGQYAGTGGAGTANQGYAGGAGGGASVNYPSGGGGGAGAVGQTPASSSANGGNGGAGVASSISGSSVTYAGGGGGGSDATAGNGGAGGGANGTVSTLPTAATANTGGGGGGRNNGSPAGAGGSGIVIISYTSATPKFVGGTITTSGGKQIHTFTSSGTLSPITPITASYLVVAGGGSGGSIGYGGGGGAGGYQASSTTLYSGATYIVTIGAGGAAVADSPGFRGNNGSNSVVSGTGLTTITSTGGGGGGGGSGGSVNGNSGGSGGGGSSTGTGGAGTSGQGNNGAAGVTSTRGGGGGGAGAAATTGDGGNGSASSISGSSVTYAGGGGALGGSTGGTGGGGAAGVSGTTNTGGGGGASASAAGSGAGGSGIVIISYAGSQVFNGGLVTSSGGNTIHTFTSTGALTPLTNNLNNSLRFRSSASAYLSRTPTVAGNRQTWTISFWWKRGTISSEQYIVSADTNSANETWLRINAADTLQFQTFGGTNANLTTSAVFRDPSAWYHIVMAYDSTQATAGNRFKLYVNGNQQTLTGTNPTLNESQAINNTVSQQFCRRASSSGSYADNYLTDVYLIDGQALEPYYFGNNDANQVWKPIQYKGTYGTNGFYLTFGNTTSTTTLGYDSSPNGNNWTCNNISLTAGTTYDAMTDVPTNTSATVANYAVLNPLDVNAVTSITEANLYSSLSASASAIVRSTIAITSGKWYWEVKFGTTGDTLMVGVCDATTALTNSLWSTTNAWMYYSNNGNKYNSSSAAYGATFTNGDIIGVALDMDAGTLVFYKNNVSQGTAYNTGLTGKTLTPTIQSAARALTAYINFGQRPFEYTPPTGYVALNTYNLPTPTILQGNKYMDATLWSGNSTSGRLITNAALFQPDFVWAKNRTLAGRNNQLFDSVRGANKGLYSNLTNAESTTTQDITAFNSNGFTVGNDNNVNSTGDNFVGWQWQAGQGSTSSNTSGSITSTVSVNTTAGFSVVTYTGTGANATVGHGLGVAPSMLFVKRRNTTGNWMGWHTSLTGSGPYIILNSTNAVATGAWNNTNPTSTVFSLLGSDTDENANGSTYVAYCWAEIAGFSKFGSYTGTGSTDGPFVYTGFRPKFVMTKRTDSISNWSIHDSSRATYNLTINELYPDTSDAEYTGTNDSFDFLSNGFKPRAAGTPTNASGGTYIFMAFAENPFKNANAR